MAPVRPWIAAGLALALAAASWLVLGGVARGQVQGDKIPAVDFARQIRPIFSENCFTCHGPDDSQRKAKLRLDTRDGAFKALRDGSFAIVPGDVGKSVLLQRIRSHDPEQQMPPPKTNKKITPQQAELMERWIAQGSPWSEHWAFVAPTKPALPAVKNAAWPRNPN
jgi:mono/diheme cytochrome c family protein